MHFILIFFGLVASLHFASLSPARRRFCLVQSVAAHRPSHQPAARATSSPAHRPVMLLTKGYVVRRSASRPALPFQQVCPSHIQGCLVLTHLLITSFLARTKRQPTTFRLEISCRLPSTDILWRVQTDTIPITALVRCWLCLKVASSVQLSSPKQSS